MRTGDIPMQVFKLDHVPQIRNKIVKITKYDLGNIDKYEASSLVKAGKLAIAFIKNKELESLEISESFQQLIKQKAIMTICVHADNDETYDVDTFSKKLIVRPAKEYEGYYTTTFRLFV